MASLSSKSEKRFRVNFHTKKAMMPITATPPATERPMIEPVPKELLPPVLLPLLGLVVAAGLVVNVFVGVSVTIVVTS
jgi:hypothetical protein